MFVLEIRFIKDGYKIAQLASTGVIHSHVRPASYYLKRQFIETKVFSSLLDYPKPTFEKFKIKTLNEILSHVFVGYDALNNAIDNLKQNPIIDIKKSFESLNVDLKNFKLESRPKSSDPSLDKVFENFQNQGNSTNKNNMIIENYFSSLNGFEKFLLSTYPNLEQLEENFVETLYKLFGVVCGSLLASFVLLAEQQDIQKNEIQKLENILRGGV